MVVLVTTIALYNMQLQVRKSLCYPALKENVRVQVKKNITRSTPVDNHSKVLIQ